MHRCWRPAELSAAGGSCALQAGGPGVPSMPLHVGTCRHSCRARSPDGQVSRIGIAPVLYLSYWVHIFFLKSSMEKLGSPSACHCALVLLNLCPQTCCKQVVKRMHVLFQSKSGMWSTCRAGQGATPASGQAQQPAIKSSQRRAPSLLPPQNIWAPGTRLEAWLRQLRVIQPAALADELQPRSLVVQAALWVPVHVQLQRSHTFVGCATAAWSVGRCGQQHLLQTLTKMKGLNTSANLHPAAQPRVARCTATPPASL